MSVTVIIPVLNGGRAFARCLGAIARSQTSPARVIVSDDGSSDGSVALAYSFGATVILNPTGEPSGPAIARNRAAVHADSDFLVFIDADVEIEPTSIATLLAPLRRDATIGASFGSYDDQPAERDKTSLYANLRHHLTHQKAREEAWSFWAGCGAVRRDAFKSVGGFKESFARPSIEDIEFGHRLRDAGWRIRSVPGARCKHLKKWTLRNLWRTEIFQRAVPWSRLILSHSHLPDDLNLGSSERKCAVLAHLIWVSLLAAIWRPELLAVTALAALALLWMNRELAGLLARFGPQPAIGGMLLHWCYYLYASTVFAVMTGATLVERWRPATRGRLPDEQV